MRRISIKAERLSDIAEVHALRFWSEWRMEDALGGTPLRPYRDDLEITIRLALEELIGEQRQALTVQPPLTPTSLPEGVTMLPTDPYLRARRRLKRLREDLGP